MSGVNTEEILSHDIQDMYIESFEVAREYPPISQLEHPYTPPSHSIQLLRALDLENG